MTIRHNTSSAILGYFFGTNIAASTSLAPITFVYRWISLRGNVFITMSMWTVEVMSNLMCVRNTLSVYCTFTPFSSPHQQCGCARERRHTHTHTHTEREREQRAERNSARTKQEFHFYVCVCVFARACVCVCVCLGEMEGSYFSFFLLFFSFAGG